MAREADKMRTIVSEIENEGGQAMAVRADVTIGEQVDTAFNHIVRLCGRNRARLDNLVAFPLCDLSAQITGTPIRIDGGQSLIV